MSNNLNLLPVDLQIGKGFSKVIKTIKSLNVILLVFFLVFAVGGGGYIIWRRVVFNSTNKNVNDLKLQLKNLELSEMQFVLLKDRVSKIYKIKSFPNAGLSLNNFNSISAGLSDNTIFDSLSISSSKTDLSVRVVNNIDLTDLLKNISSYNKYKFVDLYSFDFNPGVGYTLKLNLTN